MNKKCIISITLLLCLSGCMSSGNDRISQLSSSQMASMIYDGRTSKAEVRAQFGDPNSIDLNEDGTEKWSFKHVKSRAKLSNFIPLVSTFKRGTHDVTRELVVLFDKNDVVRKHAYTVAKGETNMGLLSG